MDILNSEKAGRLEIESVENPVAKSPTSDLAVIEAPNNPLLLRDFSTEKLRSDGNSLLQAFKMGRNAETLRGYETSLAQFAQHLGEPNIGAGIRRFCFMSAGEAFLCARSFQQSLLDAKRSSGTVNSRLKAVKALARFARDLELVTWGLKVTPLKVQACRDTRGPGLEEVAKIIRYCESQSDPFSKRNLAMVRLNFDLSLRRESICDLEIEHVDLPGRRALIKYKGYPERKSTTLASTTVKAISDWMALLGAQSGPLFPTLKSMQVKNHQAINGDGYYWILGDLAISAGVQKKVTPHGIRHTGITAAARITRANGLGPEATMVYAGHANLATTSPYLDAEQGIQGRVAEMVSGLI